MFLLNLMAELHGGVLDMNAPLTIYDPATGAPKMVDGQAKMVAPANLTTIASRTRELLLSGVKSRFLEGRYTGGEKKASFIWDAAAMAHPAYAGRKWVDHMRLSEGTMWCHGKDVERWLYVGSDKTPAHIGCDSVKVMPTSSRISTSRGPWWMRWRRW